jgi:hypothetical protein
LPSAWAYKKNISIHSNLEDLIWIPINYFHLTVGSSVIGSEDEIWMCMCISACYDNMQSIQM